MCKVLALLLILFLPCTACASTPSLIPSNDVEASLYLDRLALYPWTDDGTGRLISFFDVNAEGDIVLSFSNHGGYGRTYAGVYDRSGVFLWGISYNAKSAAPIIWDSSNKLMLLMLEHAVSIGENGVCEGVFEYTNDQEANHFRLRQQQTISKTAGDERYMLRQMTPLSLGYSQLVHIAPDGVETYLYSHPAPGIFSGLAFTFLIAFMLWIGISIVRKKNT